MQFNSINLSVLERKKKKCSGFCFEKVLSGSLNLDKLVTDRSNQFGNTNLQSIKWCMIFFQKLG